MKFDPDVIPHLGVRMYSTLSPVLSELIANAYDADAKKVSVELHDKGKKKKIIVKDDGIGMSLGDIQDKFLRIGRNRREHGDDLTPSGRKPIGKKGLGKLSFFGIVETITVDTVQDNKRNVFVMDWENLIHSSGDYEVEHRVSNKPVKSKSRTTITLTNIKRETNFQGMGVAHSVSRFFIFDKGFSVSVRRNNEKAIQVTNKMRFHQLKKEFVWNFPDDMKGSEHYSYLVEHKIKGQVITSHKPIKPSMGARGIALFSRQKLVQAPHYFAASTSSYFFSYLSGYLSADFIDDIADEDVIQTNRLSLNWEHPDMEKLKSVLTDCISHIRMDWRSKWTSKTQREIEKNMPPGWESMPSKTKKKATRFFGTVVDLFSAEQSDTTKQVGANMKDVADLYPALHWERIHKTLRKQLKEPYDKEDFLGAADEGVKIYHKEVREKSKVDKFGVALFKDVFSKDTPTLKIRHPFGDNRSAEENIQGGQESLSVGLMQSFRNLASHETRPDIRKFLTEEDFFDVLSLISFLLRRVEKAKKVKPAKTPQKSKKK